MMLVLKRRKAISDFLMSLENGVFLPNTNRGGENEVLIINEAIKRVSRQVSNFPQQREKRNTNYTKLNLRKYNTSNSFMFFYF